MGRRPLGPCWISGEARTERESAPRHRQAPNAPLPHRAQSPGQHTLLRVQPVLRLVEYHTLRPVDDLVGHLLAAMRRQAVHEDRIRRRRAISVEVTRYGASRLCRLVFGSSDMLTQVSVTTQRAPATAAPGSSVSSTAAPSARAQSSSSAGGRKTSGVANRNVNPNRAAAWIQLRATLLPSPHQATTWPAIGPRCSSNVITSAISWHGCESAVSPLITGTVAYVVISCSFFVAVGAHHDRIDIARQHACRIGNGFAAAKLHLRARQHQRVTAELAHRHFEADPGAGAWLFEDHRQRLAGQRT